MNEHTFLPGDQTFTAADSPNQRYSAFFEDDGETGYFYAVDLTRPKNENMILDAVHIYDVAQVLDRNRQSRLAIVWSDDGLKCALLINAHPHAVFDFAAKRGFCRTNYPNFPGSTESGWSKSDHTWSDEAVAWL